MNNLEVSWRIKCYYGLGQAAESIKNFGFGTLLLLYYNQVLGLPGAYSGIAVFIAISFDAISDPAVGSWSDGFRHRLGRRHPFMLAGAIPLGITYYFLFMPPLGLSEFQLFLWFTVFAILSRTALTFFHVPYLSLGAEMTHDYEERTQIVAIRTAFGMIASLAVIAIAWNFFFVRTPDNPSPQLTREPYFAYALISSTIMAVMMIISTLGTTSIVQKLRQPAITHPPFSLGRVYADLRSALRNPSFFALFWGSLAFAVYGGVHSALNMHLLTFYWLLDTNGIQYSQYGAILGGLIGLTLVRPVNSRFDKRMSVIYGVTVSATAGTLPVILKLFGLMPTDQDILTPIIVICSVFAALGIVVASITVASAMGDIADEHELHHDARQEGVYFGSHNFALKCTGALGNLVAGFGLDIINFPVNSTPGSVPEGVLFDFGLMYGAIVVLVGLSFYIFWPYSLDRARHEEIMMALAKRDREKRERGPEPVRTSPGPAPGEPGIVSE